MHPGQILTAKMQIKQSQQPDGRPKQIATTREQSKADRENQKAKVQGRSKQPRGRSGKIATTKGQFRADRNNQKSIMAIRDNTDQIKSGPEITSLKVATRRGSRTCHDNQPADQSKY